MNPQNDVMINSIVKLFKDGATSFKEVMIDMNSLVAGKRSETYKVEDGKLNVALGENNQFSLHIINEGEDL